MNKNLDLTKILKNAPKGIRLWSPICGACELFTVNVAYRAFPIVCIGIDDGLEWHFKANGAFTINTGVECLLFPSRENRNWSTFRTLWKHKHFEVFQKVLVSCYFVNVQKHIWCADLYSHFDKNSNKHCVIGNGGFSDDEILPYEGNEDKLGKPIK